MTDLDRHRVGEVEEFENGDHKIIEVDGVEIGIVCHDGDFFAFRNYCPHQGGPVCTGKVSSKLEGKFISPGERVDRQLSEERIISCPLHGWSFDIETGENIADSNIVLPSYEVYVVDGQVLIDK